MIEGPFHSRRWRERLQGVANNLEGISWILGAFAGLLYLLVLAYEFWSKGEFIKLSFLVVGLVTLLAAAIFIIRRWMRGPDFWRSIS